MSGRPRHDPAAAPEPPAVPPLFDFSYAAFLRGAVERIPRYCPEWTDLRPSDPGIALLQLFAWMAEVTAWRVARLPARVHADLLDLVGEGRRPARPATTWISFRPMHGGAVGARVEAGTEVATRQGDGRPQIPFLTLEPVGIHRLELRECAAVAALPTGGLLGRAIPVGTDPAAPGAGRLGGDGVTPFALDPVADRCDGAALEQALYFTGADLMALGEPGVALRLQPAGGALGRLELPGLLRWDYLAGGRWLPLPVDDGGDPVGPVADLRPAPPPAELGEIGGGAAVPLGPWLRATVDLDAALRAALSHRGRTSQRPPGAIPAVPAVTPAGSPGGDGPRYRFRVGRPGWLREGGAFTVSFPRLTTSQDRADLLPDLQWSYRAGGRWREVPRDRVETRGLSVTLHGPLPDLDHEGEVIQAERRGALPLPLIGEGLAPPLCLVRPAHLQLWAGRDPSSLREFDPTSPPIAPFSDPAIGIGPLPGAALYLGGEAFRPAPAGSAEAAVEVRVAYAFEEGTDGGTVEDEGSLEYALAVEVPTPTGWVPVDALGGAAGFTLDALPGSGGRGAFPREAVLAIDRAHLAAVPFRHRGGEAWAVRLVLRRSRLSRAGSPVEPWPRHVHLVFHSVRVGSSAGVAQDLAGRVQIWGLERPPRFPHGTVRHRPSPGGGHTREPASGSPVARGVEGRRALCFRIHGDLVPGLPCTLGLRAAAGSAAPGLAVRWEAHLPGLGWAPLPGLSRAARFDGDGWLRFVPDEALGRLAASPDGLWVRASAEAGGGGAVPVTHLVWNTVPAVNLRPGSRGAELHAATGAPAQRVRLSARDLVIPGPEDGGLPAAARALCAPEVRVHGEPWEVRAGRGLAGIGPDASVVALDPAEGELVFGDGRRGRIPAPGPEAIEVRVMATDGAAGNVGAGALVVCSRHHATLQAEQPFPAVGGADPEGMEEALRRAPEALRCQERAVTRRDFEALARRASPHVLRAFCLGAAGDAPGVVDVVVLAAEDAPPVAAVAAQVEAFLAERCLVGVRPRVRPARLERISVDVAVTLDPGADPHEVLPRIDAWIRARLDPHAPEAAIGRRPGPDDLTDLPREVAGVRTLRGVVLTSAEGDPKVGQGSDLPACGAVRVRIAGGRGEP